MIDIARWPALVLTAGLGTRLKPLSDVRAKAALPVAGVPLVVRILRQLHAAGVRRVVLNLHHRADTITRLVGDGTTLGLQVRYSWERHILGSAGGPARALPLLEADRFLVVNGDTLTNIDVGALAATHDQTSALATMVVVPAALDQYNAVVANARHEVVGFLPRGAAAPAPPAMAFHFVGVQAMSAAALAGVSPDTISETVRGLYPRLIAAQPGRVRVLPVETTFDDIGTPADYVATVQRLATLEGRRLDRGRDCLVDASARVDDCILWDRVRVGANAALDHCVVTDDVAIPAGARYHRMVIVRAGAGIVATPL